LQLLASFSIISHGLKEIIEGINLFNRADFFSAHDFFEELWFESENTDKLFFQGLVQISVGCYHLICGNFYGAFSQLSKGKTKLKNYLPSHGNIDLRSLLDDIDLLLEELNMTISSKKNKIDFDKIPSIKTLL
jgi:hypothetical protein